MKRIFTDIEDFGDDEDSNDEKSKSKKYRHKTPATIFLIDARKKMFLPSHDQENLPFLQSLECVKNVIRNKITALEKCFCCIILLGTKKSENPLKLNNITVIQELKLLGAEHVLKINEIINAVENSLFENEYGYDNFSVGDAFWVSSHIFNERSRDFHKTLIFFTNDDNPVSSDTNDYCRAYSIAQDMSKSFINFDLISIGEDFEVHKFYKKLIEASKNAKNVNIPKPVTKVSEMLQRTGKINLHHVPLVKLPFVISDDFVIGVSVHYLVRKVKIPFKIKLCKATNERVYSKTQIFDTETGDIVKEENILKSQTVGQKDISFTMRELKEMSDYGKREIKLLGFKPASSVSLENFVKPCAFIYPDDSEYKGSSIFFLALLKRCIARQVVPICTFCARTTSSHRFVALIGQDELLDPEKSQKSPPGFVVFFLPFAEEIRALEDKTLKRASPENVDLAVKLIKKLKFHYKPDSFQNPKLKTHWAAIEALALDLQEPEEINDPTIPNYELISRRTGNIAKEFIESVYDKDYDPESFAAPRKTKPKFVAPTTNVDVTDVEKIIRAGKGFLLTNDVLKKYLTSVGEDKGLSKLKKSDLIEKIQTHLKLI